MRLRLHFAGSRGLDKRAQSTLNRATGRKRSEKGMPQKYSGWRSDRLDRSSRKDRNQNRQRQQQQDPEKARLNRDPNPKRRLIMKSASTDSQWKQTEERKQEQSWTMIQECKLKTSQRSTTRREENQTEHRRQASEEKLQ